MIAGSISRRYAKALLQLGIDGNNYEALGAELGRVVALIAEAPELHQALNSPVVAVSQRKAIATAVLGRLGVSPTILHFVLLLLDNNRVSALPAIAREFGALIDQQVGRVRGALTSAGPIDAGLVARIKAALEKRTGKQVLLETRQDPALLAGVVVQIGDVIYDGSARAALAGIREELLSG